MNKSLFIIPLLLAFVQFSIAQDNSGFGFYKPDNHTPCLSPEQYEAIEDALQHSREALRKSGILPARSDRSFSTQFVWPLGPNNGLDDYGYHGISNFVDQNTATPNMILDYTCGNRSYDLPSGYNHGGTDIYTWPFSWYKMDNDQVKVVAAADGIIVFKSDGNFDRNCSFNSGNWNAVYIEHADGSVAWYGHLKNGSVTPKGVGEAVEAGDYLGIVGSSGSSTGPHLHFEIHDAENNLIDPFAGDCNSLNMESWWIDQRPYYDSGLNTLTTQIASTEFPPCPQTETSHEQDQFCSGDRVYFTGYYRDQLPGQQVEYKIFRPDNSIYQEWTQDFTVYYSSSWWYWYYTLPANAPAGVWTFQIKYEEVTYEKLFDVNGAGTLSVMDSPNACEGDSVILQAPLGYYGFTYQWRKDGQNIPDATDSTYTTYESGVYTCLISTPLTCTRLSNPITVTLYPPPVVDLGDDIIFLSGQDTVLHAGGNGLSYLWSTGETTASILVNLTGYYSVTVTDLNGCTGSDEVEVVLSSSTADIQKKYGITVYPNPAEHYITIDSKFYPIGLINLYDAYGRMILQKGSYTSDVQNARLQIADLPAGVYYLLMRNEKYDGSVKVVKSGY